MISLLYRLADAARNRARQKRQPSDLATGRRGEDLAHRYLQRQGYTVVARNYRPRSGEGEIDIIAWDRHTLVFVEVKSRATAQFGTPERAVDSDKQLQLERVARGYVQRANADWNRVRFDIVTVVYGESPAIQHIKDAFHPERAL